MNTKIKVREIAKLVRDFHVESLLRLERTQEKIEKAKVDERGAV